jgi:serine/threonine-protein kinase/endoribonuclease IRE1
MVSLLLWFYYATLLGASILPASRSPPTSPPQAPASPVITPALGSIAGSRDYNAALIEQFSFNAPSSLATTSDNDDTTRTASSEIQLQDLTLSTIALAVTVDGFVHGINRETGQWLWTLHDDNGAALGGYSKDERDSRSKAGAGLGGGALVKGVGRKKRGKSSNSSAPSRSSSPNVTHPGDDVKTINEYAGDAMTDEEEEEDEVYIIEPHSAGDIYLYSRSPSPGSLQKLPLSMTQLVALSPFTFPSDSSRMFAGRKETKLVGVDLKSGRLVGVFGSGAGWCEWDERSQGRVRTDEECDEDIQRRPEDLLYIARTGNYPHYTHGCIILMSRLL